MTAVRWQQPTEQILPPVEAAPAEPPALAAAPARRPTIGLAARLAVRGRAVARARCR